MTKPRQRAGVVAVVRVLDGVCCNSLVSQIRVIRKTAELCPMPHYRKNAIFVLDPSKYCTQLDRNQKAKILHLAESLERVTKRKGRRNGVLGSIGLQVLRVLLLRWHGPSGLCCPSYTTIQRETGLCRQSIAAALRRLRATGLLHSTARLVRTRQSFRQSSNLYSFSHFPRLLLLNLVYGADRKTTEGFSIGSKLGQEPLHAPLPRGFHRAVTS